MRRLLMLATIVAIVLVVSVPSYGQTVINACITKSTGQIRIVSLPGQCKSNEAPISWNVKGPEGPAGPAGPAGPVGPRGPSYADGVYTYPWVPVTVCSENGVVLASYSVTLAEPARIFAAAFAEYDRDNTSADQYGGIKAELVDGSGAVLAFSPFGTAEPRQGQPAGLGSIASLLFARDSQDPTKQVVYTAPAGTYTLRLWGNAFGLCDNTTGRFSQAMLSHVVAGATQ